MTTTTYNDSYYDRKPPASPLGFVKPPPVYGSKSPPYGSKPPPPSAYEIPPEEASSAYTDTPPPPKLVCEDTSAFDLNDDDDDDDDEITKWGDVSAKEVLIVGGLICLLVLATIVLVTFLVMTKVGSAESPSPVATSQTPVVLKTFESSNEEYLYLLDALRKNRMTAKFVDQMPAVADEIATAAVQDQDNSSGDTVAFLRAADWLVHEDPIDRESPNVILRFALAVIYFSNGGEQWTDSTHWLSEKDACDWYGVACVANELQELDLSNLHLTGEISPALALFTQVRAVWLSYNALTGTIPGKVFGSMPSLSLLYLQDNELTGEIPVSLRNNGVLETLYVHGNQLEGTWPEEFCQACKDCPRPFREFGLNCAQTPCPEQCCVQLSNCFA